MNTHQASSARVTRDERVRKVAGLSVDGPRYTITGDFHYCVIEAESSERGEFKVAAALSDSPGARPGEEWRKHVEGVLWLIPCENPIHPFDVCMRALANWYEDAGLCLTCGSADCHGGCYPESEPVQASPAKYHIAEIARGNEQDSTCCWSHIVTCAECGEHARCSGCDTCYNRACPRD
jgi:hypothetical protein